MWGLRLTDPNDLLYSGLATHYVPANRLPDVKKALAQLPVYPGQGKLAALAQICTTLQCLQVRQLDELNKT